VEERIRTAKADLPGANRANITIVIPTQAYFPFGHSFQFFRSYIRHVSSTFYSFVHFWWSCCISPCYFISLEVSSDVYLETSILRMLHHVSWKNVLETFLGEPWEYHGHYIKSEDFTSGMIILFLDFICITPIVTLLLLLFLFSAISIL
jgi:hypothetical protein